MKIDGGFRVRLTARQKAVNSVLCTGLDPLKEKLPEAIRRAYRMSPDKAIAKWMCEVVDASAPYTCTYKPQRAHYEAFESGRDILQTIVSHIRYHHPDVPIFLDCKRGDIGRTQAQYRISHLEIDGVDGMNFNPYMGKDTMEALVDDATAGAALVGLCRTSNPSAWAIQDAVLQDGRRVWELVAEEILRWASELEAMADAGLVMGAAHETSKLGISPYHDLSQPEYASEVYSWPLKRVREIVGDMLWFLIPGVGKQGGAVQETVRESFTGPGSIAINVSSGICLAGSVEKSAAAAETFQQAFLTAGAICT